MLLLSACSVGESDLKETSLDSANLRQNLISFDNLDNSEDNLSPKKSTQNFNASLQIEEFKVDADLDGDIKHKLSRFDLFNTYGFRNDLTDQEIAELGINYLGLGQMEVLRTDKYQIHLPTAYFDSLKGFDQQDDLIYFGNMYLDYLGGVVYPQYTIEELPAFKSNTFLTLLKQYPEFKVERFQIGTEKLEAITYTDDSTSCVKSKMIVFGSDLNLSFFTPCAKFDRSLISYLSFFNSPRYILHNYYNHLGYTPEEAFDMKLNPKMSRQEFVNLYKDVERASIVSLDSPDERTFNLVVSLFEFSATHGFNVEYYDVVQMVDKNSKITTISSKKVDEHILAEYLDGRVKHLLSDNAEKIFVNGTERFSACDNSDPCGDGYGNFEVLTEDIVLFEKYITPSGLQVYILNAKTNELTMLPFYTKYFFDKPNDIFYGCNDMEMFGLNLSKFNLASFDLEFSLNFLNEQSSKEQEVLVECLGFNKFKGGFEYKTLDPELMQDFYSDAKSILETLPTRLF